MFSKTICKKSFKVIGIDIGWRGKGIDEVGYNKSTKNLLIKIDKNYFRPNEVHDLRGDPKKAKKNFKMDSKNFLRSDDKRDGVTRH